MEITKYRVPLDIGKSWICKLDTKSNWMPDISTFWYFEFRLFHFELLRVEVSSYQVVFWICNWENYWTL